MKAIETCRQSKVVSLPHSDFCINAPTTAETASIVLLYSDFLEGPKSVTAIFFGIAAMAATVSGSYC